MKYLIWAMIGFGFAISFTQKTAAQENAVIYVVSSNVMSHEDSSAVAWLGSSKYWVTKIINLNQIRSIESNDVVWIHLPDAQTYELFKASNDALVSLKKFYDNGGKILLTDYAAMLPYDMGIEMRKPQIRIDTIQNDWLFDKKGFQGFRGHPLFAGLYTGEFVWDPNEDQVLHMIGYFDGSFPEQGRVIAVDKSYVFVHQERKIVFEYTKGNGKIISVGSSIFLGRDNNLKNNLYQFLGNAIFYAAGINTMGPRTYWEKFANVPQKFEIKSDPIKKSDNRIMANLPASELLLTKAKADNNFFDVAGRRALFMGKESGGLDEVWIHPLRVIHDFEIGIIENDSVVWLKNYPSSIEVRPESFVRSYSTPKGSIKEIIYASFEKSGGAIHLETSFPAQIFVRFRGDLRWMWPFDANALGDVYYSYDEGMGAVHMKDKTGDFYCVIGGDIKPDSCRVGQYGAVDWKEKTFSLTPTDLNQVYTGFVYSLDKPNQYTINIAIVGTNEGPNIALRDYRALLENPEKEYALMVEHCGTLLSSTVTIQSPDEEFNRLFKWAIIGTDRFLANTPGVGEGLLAGFATSARGWNGGHKNSGRPGYAWYFGRDSEWSGFAIDDYGDFELVKKQIKFLQNFQDRSGKIFHEISTSGVVHYDASDATPLYIILVAHYLKASGDIEFIKECWPYLAKAMKFLYSTDTDGDGLIENTNVGHGWVEGGDLFGTHTEFYLAGLWAQVLKDMSYIAKYAGKQELVENYKKDSEKVQLILNTDFWNDSTQFYNCGKYKDGTYLKEPTALVAVPMYYGLLDKEKVKPILNAYASDSFSADWGVRILSSSSKLFNPQGYHYGAIWPLFTGWIALGEYEYGNSTQGFTHITNNLYIKNNWALGFVEEVMHGVVYKYGGVCPHQCWSETNILHPAITGMIGWKPDAPNKSAVLKPRFPVHWDSVKVTNLRIDDSYVSISMKRSDKNTKYELALEKGSPVHISLMPEIVQGMLVQGIEVDGKKIAFSEKTNLGLLAAPIEIELKNRSAIIIKHTGGIAMMPIIPRPAIGDSSKGYRIVSESINNNRYEAVLEGLSGSTFSCNLKVFDLKVKKVNGALVENALNSSVLALRVTFDSNGEKYSKKIVYVELNNKKK